MKTTPALLLCALAAATAGAEGLAKTNVIIIYGDDVGYADVDAYGAKLIPTPNLDRMAAEGIRFTDAHCAAATCTPSRYSMLTGEMAFRKKGTGGRNQKPNATPMLFNLDQDIGEEWNAAASEPEGVVELHSLLTRYRSQGLAR